MTDAAATSVRSPATTLVRAGRQPVHFNRVLHDFGGTLPPAANLAHAALGAGLGTPAVTPAALNAAIEYLVAEDETRAAVVAYMLQMTSAPPQGARSSCSRRGTRRRIASDDTVDPNPDGPWRTTAHRRRPMPRPRAGERILNPNRPSTPER